MGPTCKETVHKIRIKGNDTEKAMERVIKKGAKRGTEKGTNMEKEKA